MDTLYTDDIDEQPLPDAVVDMGFILRHLSQSKGKLEIAFQKNENPAYESLCLVFIKIPIHGPVVSILREMLESEGSQDIPLSKGRLSIESRDDALHAFIGAVRIKNVNKMADILSFILERMKTLLKTATALSRRDDIGNIKTIHNAPKMSTFGRVTNPRPYTFSRKVGKND